jgi:DNA-binding Xre family transcriptional regulator
MSVLHRVNSNAVFKAMYAKGIENDKDLCKLAGINKNTLTNMNNGKLIKTYILKRIADALEVKWKSLQEGHVRATRNKGDSRDTEVIVNEIMDLLASFANLIANRTKIDPTKIRCLSYLFDEKNRYLERLGAFTGDRAFDDNAVRIPCSRGPDRTKEEEWYIISRAFNENRYICDNVDWKLAENGKYKSAEIIWKQLRGVAAYPIRSHNTNSLPIGIVCVDIPQTIQQAKWHENHTLPGTLESLGGILFQLVKQNSFMKGM